VSEHDAASVVAGMAGLTADRPPAEKFTPQQLVQRFCGQPESQDGTTTYLGSCAYMGGTGSGIEVGFDEGYEFMGCLQERGWSPLASKGDWPYVIHMRWGGAGVHAIATYVEGDLTVKVFASHIPAKAYFDSLEDCP